MGESWYSDEALAKQARIDAAVERGEPPSWRDTFGMLEPRTKPTDDERCRCCRMDAREGAGGDGRYCELCIGRGHDMEDA